MSKWDGSFNDYIKAVSIIQRNNPSWRAGQCFFNVLWELRPELADAVRATNADPFYNDSIIPEFLNRIAEMWGV